MSQTKNKNVGKWISLIIITLVSLIFANSCNRRDSPYKYYDLNDRRISKGEFYSNGENGKIEATFWGDNDRRFTELIVYRNGKKNDKWIRWDKNGRKCKGGEYKNDLKEGKEIWWYENGQKLLEANYKNGMLDGKEIRYYDNGKKFEETDYKNGKKHGRSILWEVSGIVLGEEMYDEGKLVKRIR